MRCFLLPVVFVVFSTSANNNILNFLLPNVDFDNDECSGDACMSKNTLLRPVLNEKTNNGLGYNVAQLAYMNTASMRGACLPGVSSEVYADSFTSCEDKNMEDVCTMAKRNWLVNDKSETKANADFLTTTFKGLDGGEEAVKECLKIAEEYEYEEYEFYDYAYWDDAYDYLEEGELSRVRRGANNRQKCIKKCAGDADCINKKCKKGRSGKPKGCKQCKKGDEKCLKQCKKGRSGKSKGCKKECKKGDDKCLKRCKTGRSGKPKKEKKKKKAGNNGNNKKDEEKEGDKETNNGGEGRKWVKDKPEDKDNDAKIAKRLQKLGLAALPSKQTLVSLECLEDKILDLFVKCGEKLLA